MMWRPAIWACIATFTRAARGDFVSTNYDRYNDGELGHRPHLEFYSSNEYAPILQATIWDRDAISHAGSHIFIKHDGNDSSPLSSPLILNAYDLSAVYMNRTFDNVFGTRVQENFGEKYLTFWAGDKANGIGDGWGLVYDNTYQLAYKVWAQNIPVHSDLHEFALTGNGTALVTGVNPLEALPSSELNDEWDLPSNFDVLGAVFQEIDLETNEVLFDWRALDHINPMDSFEQMGSGWDAYHINSIEKTQAGNYLISMRHIHSICLIDGQTGDIIWTLGGRGNDFVELPPPKGVDPVQPLLTMSWQHHARYVPGTNETQMTFFDNHSKDTTHGECDTECSRGLHVAINDTASPPTVQLLGEFRHPSRLQAQSQGSVQALNPVPGDLGNVFIGWGRCPSFTEHNSTGETVLDVQFSPWHSSNIPDALDNYRAYKMDWSATPWWDPAIAPKRDAQGELLVYVSWNGATEVAKWIVRGSADDSANNESVVLAESQRTGFETKVVIGETELQYLWADAVDAQGSVLRSTEIVDLDNTTISVVSDDRDMADSTFRPIDKLKKPESEDAGLSTVLALMCTGAGVFVLAIIAAGVIFWYHRRHYNRVKAEGFSLAPDDENDDADGSGDEDQGVHVDPQSKRDDDSASRGLLSKAEGDDT